MRAPRHSRRRWSDSERVPERKRVGGGCARSRSRRRRDDRVVVSGGVAARPDPDGHGRRFGRFENARHLHLFGPRRCPPIRSTREDGEGADAFGDFERRAPIRRAGPRGWRRRGRRGPAPGRCTVDPRARRGRGAVNTSRIVPSRVAADGFGGGRLRGPVRTRDRRRWSPWATIAARKRFQTPRRSPCSDERPPTTVDLFGPVQDTKHPSWARSRRRPRGDASARAGDDAARRRSRGGRLRGLRGVADAAASASAATRGFRTSLVAPPPVDALADLFEDAQVAGAAAGGGWRRVRGVPVTRSDPPSRALRGLDFIKITSASDVAARRSVELARLIGRSARMIRPSELGPGGRSLDGQESISSRRVFISAACAHDGRHLLALLHPLAAQRPGHVARRSRA